MIRIDIDFDDVGRAVDRVSGRRFDTRLMSPILKELAEEDKVEAQRRAPVKDGGLSRSFRVRRDGKGWAVVSNKRYAGVQQWGWPGRFSATRFATRPLRQIMNRRSMKKVEQRIVRKFNGSR